ncbi:NAD-dependent epimerase/dehydratase family protein [Simplicispira piscis]
MKRTVLVTGSTGALGRALIDHLRVDSEQFDVIAPARTSSDWPLDLLVPNRIVETIECTKPDLIIHLAATFLDNFDEAYAVNVLAARSMLQVIERLNLRARVVLIGSAAEYGLVTPDENPIRESQLLRPVSTYGLTKAWQTELGYLYASRGVDVVVARVFNLLGPNLSERLFVGRLHKQIAEIHRGSRTRIEVGPLSAVRDYISIDDAITQLMAIAEIGEAGNVYHVASGIPITMRQLLLRELASYSLQDAIVVEGAGLTNRRGYDVPAIYADISKTKALVFNWNADVEN